MGWGVKVEEYSQPRGSDRWYCWPSPLGFSCSPHRHLHRFSGLPVLPAEIRLSKWVATQSYPQSKTLTLCPQPPGHEVVPGEQVWWLKRQEGLWPGGIQNVHRLYSVLWLNALSWGSSVPEFVGPFPRQYPLFIQLPLMFLQGWTTPPLFLEERRQNLHPIPNVW